MVVPPPPQVPPPSGDEGDDRADDSERDRDFDFNVETPLVAHGHHKKTGGRVGIFRPTPLPTHYSAVDDRAGTRSFSGDDSDDDHSKGGVSVATVSTVMSNFRENLLLPFTSDDSSSGAVVAGLASLALVGVLLGLIMPKNPGLRGSWYPWVSSMIGFTYTVLWSCCFYPPVLLNFRRKSTHGMSNDFAMLNLCGWSFYSAYLCAMFFDQDIQAMYKERFKDDKSSVQFNDVLFSVHASLLSVIYLGQIFYYGGKGFCIKLKPETWLMVTAMLGPSAVVPVLIFTKMIAREYWLDYFYVMSFFKVCCTLTKYTKQVLHNFKRKSTAGWNIWYNFLECSGGTLSMLQVVFDSINMNDMSGVTGNLAKFALGIATIFFDGIFFLQHYVLYAEGHDDMIPTSIHANDTLVLTLNKEDDEETDEDTF